MSTITTERAARENRVKTECLALNFACLMARVLPRGKGVAPRLLGRIAKPWIHHSVYRRHGALLPIVPEALDVYVTMRAQNNSWDYWVLRIANALLEDGAVFYDIGANVGYLSVEIAYLREKTGVTVYAFEPQKLLASNIVKAGQQNRLANLRVFQAALSDRSGEVGFSAKRHCVHGAVANSVSRKSYSVPALTLDEAAGVHGFKPPDVIKIDVEGFEYAVLSGALEVLCAHRPAVIFEISEGTKDYGYDPIMLDALFGSLGGYAFFAVKGAPIDLKGLSVPTGGHVDVVAVPAHRMPRFDWFIEKLGTGEIDSLWE